MTHVQANHKAAAANYSFLCPNNASKTVECCSQCYAGLENETCDEDHYCTYTDWDAYGQVQLGGIICVAACSALSVGPSLFSPFASRKSLMSVRGLD